VTGLEVRVLGLAMDSAAVPQSEQAALNRLLAEQPWSVEGHIRMGDARSKSGDDDLACYYYRTALRLAETQELDALRRSEIVRAERALKGIEARSHAKREARLRSRGLPPQQWSPRLAEALEIAAGTKELYRQEPTNFTYPGLPSIQFFDTAQFSWAEQIEGAAPAIRSELTRFLEAQGTDDFRAYIQGHTVAPEADQALGRKKDWSVLSLCENGWLTPSIVEYFPATWQAILQAPVPRIAGWGPTIVFSMLKAGARIAPHNGMFNTRLICHLPLIVPPGCGFRVGNDVREWREGKLLIFDDTIEHEAWNESDQDRVVLIFDVWRPELSETEKAELTALFSD